jgi:hypothetical protein
MQLPLSTRNLYEYPWILVTSHPLGEKREVKIVGIRDQETGEVWF